MHKNIVIFMSLLLLSGCQIGNTRLIGKSVDDIKSEITAKKTTRSDIENLYGDPRDKGIMESKVIWRYWGQEIDWWMFVPLVEGGIYNYELQIKFDDHYIVDEYNFRTNKNKVWANQSLKPSPLLVAFHSPGSGQEFAD